MYEIGDVLLRIEQNLLWVLVFTLIAWVGGFVQIVEAVRLGARDQLPGVPIGMTVFLLAHDLSFFLRFEHWFNTVDHWYFKVFWVGMGIAVLIELFLVAQFLRYGRRSLAPSMSALEFGLLFGLFQLSAFALLWWLQSHLDDPLFLVSLVGTQVAAVIFSIPFLLVRGHARGQSRLYAWATLLGPGSLALGLFPALSPIFHTALYGALCLLIACLGIMYVVLLERTIRADAQHAS